MAGPRITPPWALVSLLALTLALAAGGALVPPWAAARHPARCSRPIHRPPGFTQKQVDVLARRGLSCAHAAQVGASLDHAALTHRIPLNAYAHHAPGAHPGHPFLLRTPLGGFRCRMAAAGSDFVDATCRRGRRYLRFEDHTR